MAKWKDGDVVQLASGGPKMTVGGKDPNSTTIVKCLWFVNGEAKSGMFAEDSLVKATPDGSAATAAPPAGTPSP